MKDTISIGTRQVGGGHPALVIAEAGVNHNGDIALAERLIDAAADAGCDAVKFQTFDPEALASPTAAKAEYQRDTTGKTGSQLEMLRTLALSQAAHETLKLRAKARGLFFLSTPFDDASADFLERLDVPAYKLSSGDLTNTPLLRHVAHKGKPMLLSTGMATLEEVLDAIEVVQRAGCYELALFHCVSSYPAAAEDCNLRAMETLRTATGVPVGWSDHTTGIEVTCAAVSLGAAMIEKHFTLDRALPGPDHRASLEPTELTQMVHAIRRVEASLGDGLKVPREVERAMAKVGRRSLCYRLALPAGTVLSPAHLLPLRPATGLSPTYIDSLVGRRLLSAVERHALVRLEDFEEDE